MTVEKMSQLFFLNKEVELYRCQLVNLDHEIRTAPKRLKAPLLELRAIVVHELKRHTLERDELTQYIDAIPDDDTRRLFVARYVEGKSWGQVAAASGIGGYDPEQALKKKVYRYMDKHPE